MSKNTQENLCSEDNLIFQKGFPHVPGIGGVELSLCVHPSVYVPESQLICILINNDLFCPTAASGLLAI